jgi:carbamoyltransferase
MKHILGLSAGFHDAAATVIDSDGEIVFAGHSERYSKIKNDPSLHPALLEELCQWQYDTVAFYERPWMHNLQQIRSGQHRFGPWTTQGALKHYLGSWYQTPASREVSYPHHLSHAAAGFQTSPYDRAVVVVIDAIGELDTISIYQAWYDDKGHAQYKRIWRQGYPHSIGLFYSAMTQRVGLRPMEEEYITMGMAAWGRPAWYQTLANHVVEDFDAITLKRNLHIGVEQDFASPHATAEDLAHATQELAEDLIMSVMRRAHDLTDEKNLVYMGGVALNCLANRLLGEIYDGIWIMPNPGDAGSSLGAAALAYGKQIHWTNAYLGHDISGPYPVNAILDELFSNKIVGVASGRAEFGPRALGNRSLLADPRGSEIKDRVNEIKRRQKFRPFAPAILAEHAGEYFDMPLGFPDSPYMQTIARCRRPDLYPAIVHIDGTSRVQTVPNDESGFRKLLEKWYVMTGCPMLLNTSLNIRGEPMVNDRADADRFEQRYGVKVCS